jgi:D-amino peptidase
MKYMRVVFGTMIVAVLALMPRGATAQGMKVFISVDMEGITGVVNWEDVDRSGKDYDYFRKIMSKEANAAVEGAIAAGATEIIVRDSHGSARNILPDLLDQKAKLIRDWSGGPKGMMEGIDDSFAAAIFIGYHAKAGTPDALLDHTSSGSVIDFSINGISMPEAGYNALIAGSYGVPVVFVAGDKALCEQAKALFAPLETVAVKEGIGTAALSVHPDVTHARIRAGVEKALRNVKSAKPYVIPPPYTLVLKLKDDAQIHRGSHYPGARQTGEWELTYEAKDIIELLTAFSMMRR